MLRTKTAVLEKVEDKPNLKMMNIARQKTCKRANQTTTHKVFVKWDTYYNQGHTIMRNTMQMILKSG